LVVVGHGEPSPVFRITPNPKIVKVLTMEVAEQWKMELISVKIDSKKSPSVVEVIFKVDCWGKGLKVCFEHLRILNFAPDFSVCCGPEASID
jgi:hypothetical protein